MPAKTRRRSIAATFAIAIALLVTALPAAASHGVPVVAVDDSYTIAPSAADLVFDPNANDSDPWDGHLITSIVAVGNSRGIPDLERSWLVVRCPGHLHPAGN